ncbi:dethiobiotin synthase [Candidatus Woesearchaeota archaeon]|nr:dethiobiotin synthase [Candidatus Woesearchaeota archaeon]
MSKTLFITGTDTGIGKTVITGCIAAALLRNGKKVAVYKPIQCGNLLKGNVSSPDLKLVKDLSGIDDKNLFNDYGFKLAASPHLASEQENKKVDINLIKNCLELLQKEYDFVLIEGAGGLMVPITREYTVLDLIHELAVPVLVVARASLGTINHSSMTLKLIKSRNIDVNGIIINYFKGGLIEEDNKRIIHTLNDIPILGVVPFSEKINDLADNFEKYADMDKIF